MSVRQAGPGLGADASGRGDRSVAAQLRGPGEPVATGPGPTSSDQAPPGADSEKRESDDDSERCPVGASVGQPAGKGCRPSRGRSGRVGQHPVNDAAEILRRWPHPAAPERRRGERAGEYEPADHGADAEGGGGPADLGVRPAGCAARRRTVHAGAPTNAASARASA